MSVLDWELATTPFVVIDVETTGLSPHKDRIVESAAVVAVDGRALILDVDVAGIGDGGDDRVVLSEGKNVLLVRAETVSGGKRETKIPIVVKSRVRKLEGTTKWGAPKKRK